MLEIDLQYTKTSYRSEPRSHSGPNHHRTGPVAERTLSELKQLRLKDSEKKVTEHPMTTLDEALQWARGKTILILDRKKVPVETCVEQIQKHHAQTYAMSWPTVSKRSESATSSTRTS